MQILFINKSATHLWFHNFERVCVRNQDMRMHTRPPIWVALEWSLLHHQGYCLYHTRYQSHHLPPQQIPLIATLIAPPFDALCIQCYDRRNGILTAFPSYLQDSLINTEFNTTVFISSGEVPVYCLPFWKVLGQHSPLTATDQDI